MVCSHLYAGFRPWRLKSLRSINSQIWASEQQDQNLLYCLSSCAFPGTVLFTFPALFITRTLLFNTNSGFFSRFSSFESLLSITVVFPRTFHHLFASLWCFTALFIIWTLLFHISCVRRTFHRLQIFPLFLSFRLSLCFAYKFHSPPSSPPPQLGPRCAFPFFSSFAHTSHSLSFSRAFCHSRLLHPSLYLYCHKTAEIKLRYLAFLAWERVDTSRRHHCFSRDGETSETNFHPIRSTTQIWVVWRHQYGISALVPQTSFRRETSCGVRKGRLFSKA